MELFSNLFKKKFLETNCLKDAVEMHCHILPGVDDGAKTLQNTLNSVEVYRGLGYKHIVMTPHIMTDWPNNNRAFLQARLDEIKGQLTTDINFSLAAEYMLDTHFAKHVEDGDMLSYDGKHVLIETSYLSAPSNMNKQIFDLRMANYVPILAHPERYNYMNESMYKSLKSEDMLFQLNLFALIGGYGTPARKKAEYLLRGGFYNFVGTDTHRSAWLSQGMERLKLNKKDLKLLEPLFENTRRLILG